MHQYYNRAASNACLGIFSGTDLGFVINNVLKKNSFGYVSQA